MIKSMGECKEDVTPFLMHWSFIFRALTHQNVASKKYPRMCWTVLRNALKFDDEIYLQGKSSELPILCSQY